MGSFIVRGLAVAAMFAVLSGCGGSPAASGGAVKYKQTWSKNYASTTCREWKSELTNAQQFAAAADMLTSARNKKDGGTGLPSDGKIEMFRRGITDSCVIDTANIAEVAVMHYLTERATFRP